MPNEVGARPDSGGVDPSQVAALENQVRSLESLLREVLARQNPGTTAFGRLDLYGELVIHGKDGRTTTISGGRIVVEAEDGAGIYLSAFEQGEAELVLSTAQLDERDGEGKLSLYAARRGAVSEEDPAHVSVIASVDDESNQYVVVSHKGREAVA